MKKFFLLSVLGLFFISCSEENNSKNEFNRELAFRSTSNCEFAELDLMAGQNILAGKVLVEADENNIYVTINTLGDWLISEAQVHAGQTIPTNKAGNPIPGQFDYKQTFNPWVSTVTFTIARSAAGLVEDCTKIATHVVVRRNNGNTIQSETAWAGNIRFNNKNWATYFQFCVVCEPPVESCDTAFLVGNNTFQSLNIAQRWGWTQEITSGDGVYTFAFHAGAGNNNLNNGYQAGTVTVTVSGSNVHVSVNLVEGVSLDDLHVYVADNMPTTAAPGQYANFTQGSFPNYTYSGDGSFWIIVHGVTCTNE
jgi:hypothetical protein